MNIAHIVCRYPPYYSGMGNVVFQTAAELSKLGHHVEVFTPQYHETGEIKPVEAPEAEEHTPELQSQIDYARRLEPSFSYGNAARLPDLGKELDAFDLVHLHYPFYGTAGLVRKWKLRNPNKPLVITYHMDTRVESWTDLFFKYYARYWMPKILGSADAIIASSFDYITQSSAHHVFSHDPGKWLELPFGVDIERFRPGEKTSEFFTNLDLDYTQPTVLFVGGMDPAHFFKGVPVLLKALFLAKKNQHPLQAIMVGDGVLRSRFETQAQALGLKNLVRFVGRVEDSDLPQYYQNADVLVLPSTTIGEAFGMVLLEAYASGIPVIASDLTGVRSVAEAAGMVFPVGDEVALAQTLAGYFAADVDRDVWRKQARTVAEEIFAWPLVVSQLDELYRTLAGVPSDEMV